MELSLPRHSARIARLGAKQGAHSSVVDQAVDEIVASGTTSRLSRMDIPQESQLDDPDALSAPQSVVTSLKKPNRKSWTHEEYCHIMWCYYYCVLNPSTKTGIVKATFDLWVSRYPADRPNDSFNANSLANMRRFIVNKKTLSDVELDGIKFEAKQCLDQAIGSETVSEDLEEINASIPVEMGPDIPDLTISSAISQDLHALQQDCFIDGIASVIAQLYGDIITIWEEVKSVPFTSRKRLPKLTFKTSKQKELLNDVNTCLNEIIENTSPDLSELNALLYAVAVHVCRVCGFTVNLVSQVSYQNTHKSSSCDTLHKLQSKVNALRSDLSIIAELAKGNTSVRVAKKVS